MASGVSDNPSSLSFLNFFFPSFDRVSGWPEMLYSGLHSYRAVLYCGAFHRIHRLVRGSGALRRGEKEVLTGHLAGNHDREETLPASIGIKT
jgi:hypothetical protein